MCCCGGKRAAVRAAFHQSPNPTGNGTAAALTNPVALLLTSGPSLVTRGPVTGLTYTFASHGTAVNVDARDARVMIAGGAFQRA